MSKFKSLYNNKINKYGARSMFFFITCCIVIILLGLTFIINISKDSFFDGLRVEVGGFVFDIILFGIILSIYDFSKEKEQKRKQYEDEIEDYRGWTEQEASYRIFGNMKRLHNMQVNDYDLRNCYFKNISFRWSNTQGINFNKSLISGATFTKCELVHNDFSFLLDKTPDNFMDFVQQKQTYFIQSNMHNTKFNNNIYLNFIFSNNDLSNSEFIKSTFIGCSFNECNLTGSKFINSTFENCFFDRDIENLSDVIVESCTFDEASRRKNINEIF